MKSRGTIFFSICRKHCSDPFIIPMKHLEKENKNDWTLLTYMKCRYKSCPRYGLPKASTSIQFRLQSQESIPLIKEYDAKGNNAKSILNQHNKDRHGSFSLFCVNHNKKYCYTIFLSYKEKKHFYCFMSK
jgi:hypothetical protein